LFDREIEEGDTTPWKHATYEVWYWDLEVVLKNQLNILGRTNARKSGKKDEKKTEGRKWNFSKKDPNAMDVDVMTVEKQERCMKNGLFFKCKKKGHLGRDCPPEEDKKKAPTASFSLRKMKGKDAHTHIKALVALMSDNAQASVQGAS